MVVEMAIFRQRQPRRRRPEIFLMEGQYIFLQMYSLLYFTSMSQILVLGRCPDSGVQR